MTAWVAIVVLGAMRVVEDWMLVWGAMEASREILEGCEWGVAFASWVGGRVARRREVWRRRWGVSTRRIRGVGWAVGVLVGWM